MKWWMNNGELIVHDALELGICPGQAEVNLKKIWAK